MIFKINRKEACMTMPGDFSYPHEEVIEKEIEGQLKDEIKGLYLKLRSKD